MLDWLVRWYLFWERKELEERIASRKRIEEFRRKVEDGDDESS